MNTHRRDSMKGQGALEYLLILAAVLAIAAIVIFVVTSMGQSAKEDSLRKDCTRAVEGCKLLKVAVGNNSASVCNTTCNPCRNLDTYIVGVGKPAEANQDTCQTAVPL